MLGMFFAAVCTAGLFRLWRPRRYGHCGGYGGGTGWGRGRHGHRGPDRSIGWLVRNLNANPEQEAAIRQSADEIRQAFRKFDPRGRLDVLSAALTAETFDRDKLKGQMREPETGSLSEAIVNAVERLRASLDVVQRQRLASLLTGRGRVRGCR